MFADGSVLFETATLPSSGVTPAFGVVPPMPAGLEPTILGQPIGP
jgi:hypothetical protein